VDRAIVGEEEIGDRRQPLECLIVAVDDRLIGDVAARHHQRPAAPGEQQLVERRVGEDHAELPKPRCHPGGQRGRGSAGGEDDGALVGRQKSLLDGAEIYQRPRRRDRRDHHRERLVLAVLA
jgi:hypothetical protein